LIHICQRTNLILLEKDFTKYKKIKKFYKLKKDTMETTNEQRPSWDEYFMEVCRAIAKRATCNR
jgi:deoxycytidylate deaminase